QVLRSELMNPGQSQHFRGQSKHSEGNPYSDPESKVLRIGVLNGDDIGHEIVPASVEISRAAAELYGVAIDWRPLPIGRTALDTHGHTLPPETLEALKTLDGWILGPIGHRAYPKVANAINPHPILRKQFNL